MMKQKIKESLSAIGLSEKEAQFYMALLEVGASTILPVAKKAKLKRTSVYNFVDKLMELGLVSTFVKNNRHYYKAEHPDVLNMIMDTRREQITQALPALIRAFESGDSKPCLKTFYGVAGVKQVTDRLLRCKKKEVKAIVHLDSLFAVLDLDYWTALADKMIAQGIMIKTLRHQNQKERIPQYKFMHRSEYKDTTIVPRYIPEHIHIPNSIFLYDDKVVVLSPENEQWAMELRSQSFSTSLRVFHQMLWGISSK